MSSSNKKIKKRKSGVRKLSSEAHKQINEVRKLMREQRLEMKEMLKSNRKDMQKLSKKHRAAIRKITSDFGHEQLEKLKLFQRKAHKIIDWRRIGKKPNHLALAKKGYFVADLHMHSIHSDGLMTLDAILKRASELKINISITNHDEISGSLKALNNKYGVKVLPGIEVSTKEGRHLLFYFLKAEEMKRFYNKEIKDRLYRPLLELVDLRAEYDTILVWAHPKGIYPWQNHKITFQLEKIDGLEAYNSWGTAKNIREVHKWAKENGKFSLGSSDAHLLEEIGRVVTYTRARNFKEFFNKLRKGQGRIAGKDTKMAKNAIKYGWRYMFERRALLKKS